MQIQSRPPDSVRVGLELAGRRVARDNDAILLNGVRVGRVSSGTFGPTVERPIAMGYVRPEYVAEGTELSIDVRGRLEVARVVKLPFYRRQPQRNGS